MTRLTNSLKEVITQNALEKSGVIQQQKELDLEYNKLALDVRIEALGGKEKADALDQLHQNLLEGVDKLKEYMGEYVYITNDVDYRVYVSFGGMRNRINYSETIDDQTMLLTPCESKCRFAADHPLSIKFLELEEKKSKLDKKYCEVKVNVSTALKSCTTVKRLLTIWPEAKELLPKDVEKASVQLPALKVEKLNEIIGLPTEKAA
ncbi:Nmad5 family putative nucleotide modification protein [Providencia sp. PROV108]|uniref:Nmad5 family putative nucleotide modification protein n=1 Tax=Providencia sp. PROV108 TaxID=2949820 RepID=UPI00234A01B9|nr:Nmad5 family putative nucleotide modification protein [Providencia sp. PROV108]